MMTVPVEIRHSEIHGMGIFATSDIRKGAVLWMFTPGLDQRKSAYSVKYSERKTRDFIMTRGYLHPGKNEWVICCDEAQFLNFPRRGEEANIKMGEEQDGENILLASRDIAIGEELLVPPESDADYARKVATYESS